MATPLGPNQAMKIRSGRGTLVPASATKIATGRASSSVPATTPTPPHPSSSSSWKVSSAPNTAKIAQLDDLDDLLAVLGEALAQVRAPVSDHDRGHEHGDEAVAARRQHGDPVGREGEPEAVERLLAAGDRRSRRPARGISSEPTRPQTRPYTSPRPMSCSTKCHHTKSVLPASRAAANASTAGSASPSLRPDSRLSVCRTDGRHPLVGHDPRRRAPGRWGSAGPRAAATPSSPAPPARARAAPPRSPSPASPRRGGAGAPASGRAAARPRPRGRRGTGSRSAPPSPGP